MSETHPMQPVFIDEEGIARFKPNRLVRFLLDWATPRGMSLNELAMMPWSDEDRMQLAQLIGYSICGYGDLSYVTDESFAAADAEMTKAMTRHKK